MKTNLLFAIAIRIIILFGLGMAMSYASPFLHGAFGDVYVGAAGVDEVDPEWEWAAPHYWYMVCMIFLFILSVIDAIVFIVNQVRKNYPDLE